MVARIAGGVHSIEMEGIICDITALNYWRTRSDTFGGALDAAREPSRRGSPRVDPPTASLVRDLSGWGFASQESVHLLVTSPESRRVLEGASCTLLGQPVPANSFVRALGRVYVVCPELLFTMMADRLKLVELLELGHELCGTYRLDPLGGAPTYNVAPLTNVSALRDYVRRAHGIRGRKKAEQALRWVADDSRSPAETALSIYLRLPHRLGGCGLGAPQLNRTIALNEAGARILGRDAIQPDLYWPGARHPCEYDSRMYHSSQEQADYDERRRNAYAAMGMSVTVLRSRHLCDHSLLDDMVGGIRSNTHIYLGRAPDDYAARQRKLFDETFAFWVDLKERSLTADDYAAQAAGYDVAGVVW